MLLAGCLVVAACGDDAPSSGSSAVTTPTASITTAAGPSTPPGSYASAPPTDGTDELARRLGEPLVAPSPDAFAGAVASALEAHFAGAGDQPARVNVVAVLGDDEAPRIVVSVRDLADDSIAGEDWTIVLRRDDSGTGWTLAAAEQAMVCARGLTSDGTQCV